MSRKWLASCAALAAVVSLGACASKSVEPPTDAISDASSAIERAKQADAYEFAAFEVVNAERKLDRAKELAGSEDDDKRTEARRLAEQAAADGRLAEAKARLAQTRANHQEMKSTVDSLRDGSTGDQSREGSS